MKRIAVFASGSGTNAENLIRHFRTSDKGEVVLVLCNKPGAGVIDRAGRLSVPVHLFDRTQFSETGEVLQVLQEARIDFLVLAGFLWLVPGELVEAYPGRIVNIHPALLPAYGGKGMYGQRVHEAVLAAGEKESGITIHHVNAKYDEGDVIFQARCPVEAGDTPDVLAARVHALEYAHFPGVVEKLL
ncbi:MAG: phosphoribosylglycinamide formyltransferase [Bacteroidales bacterium]